MPKSKTQQQAFTSTLISNFTIPAMERKNLIRFPSSMGSFLCPRSRRTCSIGLHSIPRAGCTRSVNFARALQCQSGSLTGWCCRVEAGPYFARCDILARWDTVRRLLDRRSSRTQPSCCLSSRHPFASALARVCFACRGSICVRDRTYTSMPLAGSRLRHLLTANSTR